MSFWMRTPLRYRALSTATAGTLEAIIRPSVPLSITYIQQPLAQIADQAGEYLFRLIEMKDAGEDFGNVKDKITLKATLV